MARQSNGRREVRFLRRHQEEHDVDPVAGLRDAQQLRRDAEPAPTPPLASPPAAVSWLVGDRAYRATLQAGATPYTTLGGYPVASGEQSLPQLLDDGAELGAAQCITPRLRDEDRDGWREPQSLKIELIRVDDTSNAALKAMVAAAESFLSEFVAVARLPLPDGIRDLVTAAGAVESGSYGRRSPTGRTWLYGTGLAEPRLAQASAALS